MRRPIATLLIALVLTLTSVLVLTAASATDSDSAAAPKSQPTVTLEDFLRQVERAADDSRRFDRQREERFTADLAEARRQLAEAEERLHSEQRRQEILTTIHADREKKLIALEKELQEQQGDLGEIFGVVRQSAGDLHARLLDSPALAAQPQKLNFLRQLADSRELPTMAELERFWLLILREMADGGRIESFTGTVVAPDGTLRQDDITRIGVFNTIADGRYLLQVSGGDQFLELPRQPDRAHLKMAARLEQAKPGELLPIGVDPSRGAILSQLALVPSIGERILQGRAIGMLILGLGAIGLLIFVVRFAVLTAMARRVDGQLRSDLPRTNNPVGRILALHDANCNLTPEALEIRLDEAIHQEIPKLEKGLSTIKILAAVAPLLGLLGTVVGMIQTFQAITLFGTGDPQLMAGGISQALVTTALGLSVAIPLIFLHSVAAAKSRYLINVMEGQGAGLLAEHLEKSNGGPRHAA